MPNEDDKQLVSHEQHQNFDADQRDLNITNDSDFPTATHTNRDDAYMTTDNQPSSDAPQSVQDVSAIITPAPALASLRYNRQMLVPSVSVSGQERISNAKVLIVGLGGLGSPAALYLAGAGVGVLGLLDDDLVEVTNLHRQVVHRESSVRDGMTKVESAARGCRDLNSEVVINQHTLRLDVSDRETANQVFEIFQQYDIILDCTDNPATRYLINDLCVMLGKTLVSGAAQRLEGQVLVLNYLTPDRTDRGPCYRCVFPTPPNPDLVKGCGEIGILGPVVGTIGTLMATETLRLIVKSEYEARKPSMLLYNAWPSDPRSMFRTIGLRGKRTDCIACGDTDTLESKGKEKVTREGILNGRLDYITFCGVSQAVILTKDERISAALFVSTLANESPAAKSARLVHPLIVDVRETYEIEMGTKINTGLNIPISSILRSKEVPVELKSSMAENDRDAVLFVCQRGNDSQVAAKRLIDWRASTCISDDQEGPKKERIFVGDVVGGLAAVEKLLVKDVS